MKHIEYISNSKGLIILRRVNRPNRLAFFGHMLINSTEGGMWHGLNSKFQVCRSLPMLKIVEDNVGHGHQQNAVRVLYKCMIYKGMPLARNIAT